MQCIGMKAFAPLVRCISIIESPLYVSHLKSFVVPVVVFMLTRHVSEVMAELYERRKKGIRGVQFISQQLNISTCRM